MRLTPSFAATFALSCFLLTTSKAQAAAPIDWSQPPVACVEDIVPQKPDRPCLDLTGVTDPLQDWPAGLSDAETYFWQMHKRPLQYCRAMEVLRREAAQPGSQTPGRIELSWMQSIAIEHRDGKIKAIYEASRRFGVPGQILSGALYQESLLSELGIAEDGLNYSCGVGQINLIEWCHWAEAQSPAKKNEIGWPQDPQTCSSLTPLLIRPFYEIAKTRLKGLPEYRLQKRHFAKIDISSVQGGFPAGTTSEQELRYQVAESFIQNCSDPQNGIEAKAHELASLYNEFVPRGLKLKDRYGVGQHLNLKCQDTGAEGAYPLNAGWLLAVGMYNAGPRALDLLAYYHHWTLDEMASPDTFKGLEAPGLVQAFYWGGRYSAADDLLHLTNLAGESITWNWMKPCVLQRHIARVVQHATAANGPVLADTLEGAYSCAKSVFDPKTGALMKSGVPPQRQKSSGVLSK